MASTSSDKMLTLRGVLVGLGVAIVIGTYAYARSCGFQPSDNPWFRVTLLWLGVLLGAQSLLRAKSRFAWEKISWTGLAQRVAAWGLALSLVLWLSAQPPASEARSSEPKKGPELAPATVEVAASHALGEAAKLARGCRPKGGPVGTGKVRVAYSQDGNVESVQVLSEKFRDGLTGGCLRTAFRRAQIPAFSGPPPMFIKTFSIPPE